MGSENTYRQPEVYFHTGLGKVASKFFQFNVFPNFRNIHYIRASKFYSSVPVIKKGKHPAYLVSREFDTTYKEEVGNFAAHFPDAHPILMLRRHDEWIESQYKRFIKNGYRKSFSEFIDLDHDKGRFDLDSLNFFGRIRFLETTFRHKPLVMIYDDLISDPWNYIKTVANYCHATCSEADIDLKARHKSYNEKQLRFMKRVARRVPFYSIKYSKSPAVRIFLKLPFYFLRYFVLYSALLIPGKWIGNEDLIKPEELEQIRDYTADDWEACVNYVASSGMNLEPESQVHKKQWV